MQGVYAALLTHRRPDERVDSERFGKTVAFLLSKGITSFAVNGATGEFPLTRPDDLRCMLDSVMEVSEGRASVLCGVGAPGLAGTVELANVAAAYRVQALLLPMPQFFPYAQEDLALFSRSVAGSTALPILLYNLPAFTSPLHKETVSNLITQVPNIIGVKDSSGSLDILRDLTENLTDAVRLVGNDSALAPALEQRLCDGVVSGVACVVPELIELLYRQKNQSGTASFEDAARLLSALIEKLDSFPTPWALKWLFEARGIADATFAQPVSESRMTQSRDMMEWFRANILAHREITL